MYKIIYKKERYDYVKINEVVVETENIDIYLKLMKWHFCIIPLDDVTRIKCSIIDFQVKDTESQTTADVIDLFSIKEIAIMQNNVDVRYYEDSDINICKMLKKAKEEPWYYSEENISKLKRYITYYKDEIVGYSDYPYDHLLKYISSLLNLSDSFNDDTLHLYDDLKRDSSSLINLSETVKLDLLNKEELDWLNGEPDKNNRKINDYYIKDLISGEVITDFRHLVKDEKGESAFGDAVGIGKEFDWASDHSK